MDLSATSLYLLRVDQLRIECVKRGLVSSGSVRLLRRRLREFLRNSEMGGDDVYEHEQAAAAVDAGSFNVSMHNGPAENNNSGTNGSNYSPVLMGLVKQIPPLLSEKPEEILKFFVRVQEMYKLGLADDRTFIMLILPLLPAGVLQFFGVCLQQGNTWAVCKAKLIDEYFPHFIRERLVRELIVFNLHQEGEPLRAYFDQVFQNAEFLRYEATEEQLVQRVIMNLHPSTLNLVSLVNTPKSRRELAVMASLVEEQSAVLNERQRALRVNPNPDRARGRPPDLVVKNGPVSRRPVKCWDCGRIGHVRGNCPGR